MERAPPGRSGEKAPARISGEENVRQCTLADGPHVHAAPSRTRRVPQRSTDLSAVAHGDLVGRSGIRSESQGRWAAAPGRGALGCCSRWARRRWSVVRARSEFGTRNLALYSRSEPPTWPRVLVLLANEADPLIDLVSPAAAGPGRIVTCADPRPVRGSCSRMRRRRRADRGGSPCLPGPRGTSALVYQVLDQAERVVRRWARAARLSAPATLGPRCGCWRARAGGARSRAGRRGPAALADRRRVDRRGRSAAASGRNRYADDGIAGGPAPDLPGPPVQVPASRGTAWWSLDDGAGVRRDVPVAGAFR